MTVFNLGSINVDLFYRVPHLPLPGETLPATFHEIGLGGKGANQSAAVAKAGSTVRHIGMIGQDNQWVLDRMSGYGIDVSHVTTGNARTGHAIIMVDDEGENAIVTFAGANYAQSAEAIAGAMERASPGDIFMFQNEVSLKNEAVRQARDRRLFVVYSAAPFKPDVVGDLLPFVDLLVLNEIEATQLGETLAAGVAEIPVPHLLITRGSKGAAWRDQSSGEVVEVPAFPVDPVDTTGAGDCFIGYTIAGLDQGLDRRDALRLGAAAAAVKVTRPGTADAIPLRVEVDRFLAGMAPR